ncbi:hypothetical protein LCGC14_2020730, partial [marine sediment metagenome]
GYEVGRELTCSDQCHEDLTRRLIARFGEFKKVVRQSTGVAYKVPTRDIIERGVREQDLDQYPIWDEEERGALMCQPVSFRGYVVPGSLPDKCSKCGGLAWVSPSSLLILHDNPGIEILCMPCALAKMEKDPEFEIQGVTPAQTEEILEYLNSR